MVQRRRRISKDQVNFVVNFPLHILNDAYNITTWIYGRKSQYAYQEWARV